MTGISPAPKFQAISAAGVPLSGGKVYTYAAGTTTPLTTYTDSTGAQANTNPVILDSRGEANIWLSNALYKFKLTDSNDVEIWTVDNLGSTSVSPVFTGNVVVTSNSSLPALKITQTGSGYGLLVEDSSSVDTSPFVVDAAGKVGVGTLSPAASLDVATGYIQLSSGATAYSKLSGDVSLSHLSAEGARGLTFDTAGSERVRVTSAGDVGIGFTTPAAKLDVNGSVKVYNNVYTDVIAEYNSGVGVTVAGVLCKNSQVAAANRVISAQTSQTVSAGATAVAFTSIPSWVKRITVMVSGLDISSTNPVYLQIGTSSGLESTGYLSACINGTAGVTVTTATAAHLLIQSANATAIHTGHVILTNLTGNTWVISSTLASTTSATYNIATTTKTLSGVLDRLSIVRTSTDTFDAGSVNILYE